MTRDTDKKKQTFVSRKIAMESCRMTKDRDDLSQKRSLQVRMAELQETRIKES
jgi:hypothetical protein